MKVHTRWQTPTIGGSVLLLALTMAACGGGGGGGTDGDQPGAGQGPVQEPTEPVTIEFASWVGNDRTMKQFVQDFQKEYPNITVELQNIPAEQASQKLSIQVANNTAPDVAYVNASDTSDFASRDALVNLDDYIARSDVVAPGDFVEAFKTFVTYEGSMWGLPFDGESTGLFYRTDLFEQAGIESPPETWEEFRAAAEQLTQPENNQYGYILFAPEAAYYWYPWLYQAGGNLLSEDSGEVIFDSPEAQEAAEYYIDLVDYSPPDYLNSNSYDARTAFAQGQVAMYMAGAWFAGTLTDEFPDIEGQWATAPLPSGPAGCKTTIAGDSLVMFSDTENPDAAWLWLEYLTRPEIMAEWTYKSPTGTLLPPRSSLLNSPDLVEEKPVLEGFAELMECGVASTVANPKFPEIEQVLNEELGKAMYGEQTAAEALENAAAEAQEILSE